MRRRPWRVLGGLAVGLLLGYAGLQWVPEVLVYVPSPSLPKGWYARAWPTETLQVGDLVVLAVPASLAPWMPAEVRVTRLLKAVAALKGMRVCWEQTAMTVEQEGPWLEYAFHRDIPAPRVAVGCQVLQADELVLVGTHERSMDSRYVGPVAHSLVQWRAWPVWTWEAP